MPNEIVEKIILSGVELEEKELVNLYWEKREEVLEVVKYGLKYDFNAGFIKKALEDFLLSGDIKTAIAFLGTKKKKEIHLMRDEFKVIIGKQGGRCYGINFGFHFAKERERLLEQLPECPYKNIHRGLWIYDKIEYALEMSQEELETLYEACEMNISTHSNMEQKIRAFIGAEDFVEKTRDLIASIKKQKEARGEALERREKNYREVKEEIDKEIVAKIKLGWITTRNFDIYVFANEGKIYKSTDLPAQDKKMNYIYTLKKSNKIPKSFKEIGFSDIPKDIIDELKEKKPEIAVEIRLSSE